MCAKLRLPPIIINNLFMEIKKTAQIQIESGRFTIFS